MHFFETNRCDFVEKMHIFTTWSKFCEKFFLIDKNHKFRKKNNWKLLHNFGMAKTFWRYDFSVAFSSEKKYHILWIDDKSSKKVENENSSLLKTWHEKKLRQKC